MQDKILAILPEDFDVGFKLTGADVQKCASSQEAKASLEKELVNPGHNIVLIDEKFILDFDARFNKKIQQTALPLIMAIPLKRTFKEEDRPKDYFLKMVQNAIGYEIRIK